MDANENRIGTSAATRCQGSEETRDAALGSAFVSNYPPYSYWKPDHVPGVLEVLHRAPAPSPFGIYVHVPFCRTRCSFCYYKVYTRKNSHDIREYLAAAVAEASMYSRLPYLAGRKPRFVYFGGGTPSYLSVDQLRFLFEGLQRAFAWDEAEEVAFECEPGTLQKRKLEALRKMGVTRLSFGVQNFDPGILETHHRAHRAKEIVRAYRWAREVGHDQINLDLIAGMLGETDANWKECIDQVLALDPDSVTLYPMEIPHNSAMYRLAMDGGMPSASIADPQTARRWLAEAFATLERHSYVVDSAYTVKKGEHIGFVYRDALWHGSDMLPIGVSSFGCFGGHHLQNESRIEDYVARVRNSELPLRRAYPMNEDERLLRELILQLKIGRLEMAPLRRKFAVDPLQRFRVPIESLIRENFATVVDDALVLSRDALLQVDALLPRFYLPQHQRAA